MSRFKIGDRSAGVEVIGISEGMYNLLCQCDRPFSRGMKMQEIPSLCRPCYEEGLKIADVTNDIKGIVHREYTAEEEQMIKDFK